MEITFDDYPEWDIEDFIDEPCSNCGRQRVFKCTNGKHRCEKCNCVEEDKEYCEAPLV